MSSILEKLNQVLEKLLITMTGLIVLTVSWQVFSRFVMQLPSSITEELARFLLIWIGLLGAAYAYRTKAHLGLDLLVEHLAPVKQRIVRVFIELSVTFFAITVMVYGGFSLVAMTFELKQVSAALEWQMAAVYSVIPLSGVFISLYALDNLKALLLTKATSGAL